MRSKKATFSKKLEEVKKKMKETPNEVFQKNQSQSAQYLKPPNPNNDLNWKLTDNELPPYYKPIHIWDGKELRMNWTRVWSESLGNVYVNNDDNTVVVGYLITHWTAPANISYPKFDPLVINDILTFSINDIQQAINKMSEDIINPIPNGGDTVQQLAYNTAIHNCITILKKMIRSHNV